MRTRGALRARVLVVLFAVAAASCSLLIQHNTEQCLSDADCTQFADSVCDLGGNVCVAKAGPGSTSTSTTAATTTASSTGAGPGGASASSSSGSGAGGASCESDAGCWQCTPIKTIEFLNACTNAQCEPFDDHARCKNLTPDGGLPPIPDAGSD